MAPLYTNLFLGAFEENAQCNAPHFISVHMSSLAGNRYMFHFCHVSNFYLGKRAGIFSYEYKVKTASPTRPAGTGPKSFGQNMLSLIQDVRRVFIKQKPKTEDRKRRRKHLQLKFNTEQISTSSANRLLNSDKSDKSQEYEYEYHSE